MEQNTYLKDYERDLAKNKRESKVTTLTESMVDHGKSRPCWNCGINNDKNNNNLLKMV